MGLSGVKLSLVDSFDAAGEFLRWLSEDRGREWLCVDTETTGLDWWRDRLRMIQIGDARHGWAIPYGRWGGLADEAFKRARHARWTAHNAPFDQHFLSFNGFDVPPLHNSMALVYLKQPDRAKGLKPASARLIDKRAQRGDFALKAAMQKAKWTWATVPWNFDAYWQYAALDTVLGANLTEHCWDEVQRDYADAYDLIIHSDEVLYGMELRGMRIDVQYVAEQKLRLDARLNELLEEIDEQYGVDPFSPEQVVRKFWDEGVDLKLTTAGGKPSVRKEALQELDHPLASLVLEARKCQKMSVAYFGNMLEYAVDDILHPNINSLAAVTGRMSITRPALQTLPRTKLIRDAFIPRKGNKLVLADFNGQEMRVFAAFANDPGMLEAFARGEDLHDFVARAIFGDNFTPDQRRICKSANFADIYGAGDEKFAKTAGVSVAAGRAVREQKKELFPRAERFKAKVAHTVVERARENGGIGWITTLAGRRVPVKKDKAYVGVNYIVQGSCSDILRKALVDLDHAGLAEYVVLPIHDELAFDVPEADAEDVAYEAARIMEQATFGLKVKMVVEPALADRWGEKYK